MMKKMMMKKMKASRKIMKMRKRKMRMMMKTQGWGMKVMTVMKELVVLMGMMDTKQMMLRVLMVQILEQKLRRAWEEVKATRGQQILKIAVRGVQVLLSLLFLMKVQENSNHHLPQRDRPLDPHSHHADHHIHYLHD
ncbi:hypothetical protein LUU34_00108000 [Aix galericulata]|nr:hypothetical protein LUU34_00108000 [Aix galericulata]